MRSHYCGQLNETLVDQTVTVCGWVHRRRDHGGVIFLDMRDRDGIAQFVVDPDTAEAFANADRARSEFVLRITGRVRLRPEGTQNANMPTGMIEVLAKDVEVLNTAVTPPFQLDEHGKVGEEVRLKHRYIDLRRPDMIEKLCLRSRISHNVRAYLENQGFLDIETPVLTRATPEGARDYLVPSRTHAGSFFALPQSPQLFKQLLMVAGFDRYYQIAKCFRDEDLRADRQPEVDDLMQQVDFKVFSGPASADDGRVAALKVPGGAKLSRKEIDEYTKFVGIYGAKGLAWIKVNERAKGLEGLQSPIVKFMENIVEELLDRVGAEDGDIIFFGADKARIVNEAIGALRVKLGADLELYTQEWAPLWVVDFPMFEADDSGRLSPMHHPFTAPSCTPEELKADPANALSRAYDMVLNGTELGGGSIRIHDQTMQSTVFEILGIGEEEAQEKFGFLLDALQYGAPPHGGLAFGLDRLVMLMVGAKTIREVIAFPKTQSAACLMTNAPGEVSPEQLKDLNIRLRQKVKAEPAAE